MKQDDQTPEKDVPSAGAMKLPFLNFFFLMMDFSV